MTGAPGCGKTRLSIEIADRLKAGFSDGVRFVGLALIPGQNSVDERGQARQVWSAIAWALGIVDEPKRSDAAIVWRVANGVELPTAGARPGDERLRVLAVLVPVARTLSAPAADRTRVPRGR